MGYDVVALDVDSGFCDLTRLRLRRQGLRGEVVRDGFLGAASLDELFDAIVFFECFHHCLEHDELLGIF